jgi:hypothetical protein
MFQVHIEVIGSVSYRVVQSVNLYNVDGDGNPVWDDVVIAPTTGVTGPFVLTLPDTVAEANALLVATLPPGTPFEIDVDAAIWYRVELTYAFGVTRTVPIWKPYPEDVMTVSPKSDDPINLPL